MKQGEKPLIVGVAPAPSHPFGNWKMSSMTLPVKSHRKTLLRPTVRDVL